MDTLLTREVAIVVDPHCLENALAPPLRGSLMLVEQLATAIMPPVTVRLVFPGYLATRRQLNQSDATWGLPQSTQ